MNNREIEMVRLLRKERELTERMNSIAEIAALSRQYLGGSEIIDERVMELHAEREEVRKEIAGDRNE